MSELGLELRHSVFGALNGCATLDFQERPAGGVERPRRAGLAGGGGSCWQSWEWQGVQAGGAAVPHMAGEGDGKQIREHLEPLVWWWLGLLLPRSIT